MKLFAGLAVLFVSGVVAGVVVYRLSSDALALIIGVLLGLLALAPALAVLVLTTRRDRTSTEAPPSGLYPHQQPPIIVVSGGYPQLPAASQAPQASNQLTAGAIPPPITSQPRRFRVMGYELADVLDAEEDVSVGY